MRARSEARLARPTPVQSELSAFKCLVDGALTRRRRHRHWPVRVRQAAGASSVCSASARHTT